MISFVSRPAAGLAVVAAGALALSGCGKEAQEAVTDAEVSAADAAATLLGQRLKSRLLTAMADGGPPAAIAVCAEEAGVIAAQVSEETGYQVGRTSLRVRNSANAPDDWERDRLLKFIDALEDGVAPGSLSAAEMVTGEDGQEMFRYARPIMLEAPCTTCHGTAVDPALRERIVALYPDDAATGFEVGEIRGMFTVRKDVLAR